MRKTKGRRTKSKGKKRRKKRREKKERVKKRNAFLRRINDGISYLKIKILINKTNQKNKRFLNS